MARPLKKGLDYFPLDVDFFDDEKIEAIQGEFGINGEIVAVKLLCEIYRGNGYYAKWDELFKMRLLKRLPGLTPDFIEAVINRMVQWGFFNKAYFDSAKILTSKGIQERFLLAAKRREDNQISEYDCINPPENIVIAYNNPQSDAVSADISTQSKVKESKVNKIKVEERKGKESENAGISSGSPPPDFSNSKNGIEDLSLKAENENKKKPGRAARKDTSELLSLEDWGDRERFDAAMPEDWPEAKKEHYWFALLIHSNKGNKYKNWALTAMNWARKDEKNEETPWVKAGNKTTKPKESPAQTDDITRIIDEFNALTGSDYDTANEEIRGYLAGRLMDGCQLQDMLDVIALKAIEWGGAEQRKYLKFQTLFKPANYPGYVQEVKDAKAGKIKVKPNETHAERYKRTTRELEHALAVIEGRLPHPGKVA